MADYELLARCRRSPRTPLPPVKAAPGARRCASSPTRSASRSSNGPCASSASPPIIVEDLDAADMVVTLKAQERRQPRRLRDALARGSPSMWSKQHHRPDGELPQLGLRRGRPQARGRGRRCTRWRRRSTRRWTRASPWSSPPEQPPPAPPAPDHRALRPDLGEQGGGALPAGGDLSGVKRRYPGTSLGATTGSFLTSGGSSWGSAGRRLDGPIPFLPVGQVPSRSSLNSAL